MRNRWLWLVPVTLWILVMSGHAQINNGGGGAPTGACGGDLGGSFPNCTVVGLNSTSLAGLGTGIVKNTTGTGVPSIAVAADIPNLPLNKIISPTGAITTLADGDFPWTINCALTSGTTCLTFGETTAATTAGAVEDQITTLNTSTAIPLQITQGAGVNATNTPLTLNIAGGLGGTNAGATSPGLKGGGTTITTGTGSNAGATSGTGGAGGDLTLTTGPGGTAAAGSTTGKGGDLLINLGAAGGTGTAGAPGQISIAGATVGAANTTPYINLTGTWNTSGAVNGILANITGTAQATGSAILNLQLSSTNFFKVSTQAGTAQTVGPNIVFGGSKPQFSTPGTTPYLNINTLSKGTMNTCTFALTTSTLTLALSPVSLCTYTLPNTAVTWAWQCGMGWSNPAGTTPTFAIGVTWAQAPSTAFQMADIYTTNAGVGTEGTTATTTNANILATGTLTPAATIFQAQASGTFTASATSGTFTPTLSLTGTGATGTAVGWCDIF